MEGKKTENKRHKVGICKNAHKVVSIQKEIVNVKNKIVFVGHM